MSNTTTAATKKPVSGAKFIEPFVSGGLSACFASFCIHPIDLVKVRLQLFATLNPNTPKPTMFQMGKNVLNQDGFFKLYAGLSASLLRQAVYGTARIGLHRFFSQEMEIHFGGTMPFWGKAFCGTTAGALAVLVGTPMDVALVRMQADSMKPIEQRRNYKNVFDALFRINREEGFGRLYRGLGPNILRGIAMNVGMLACFDEAKEYFAKLNNDDKNHPAMRTQLPASAVASVTAAVFSLPFDMIKSRLQDMKPMADGKLPYKGVADCFVKIFRNEGFFAYWTGLSAYYTRTAPHAIIILLTSEQIKRLYLSLVDK